jgi:hypothetical protein
VCGSGEICYLGSCEIRACRISPYSEAFLNGVIAVSQCTAWRTWTAGLDGVGCSIIEISGTYDTTGVACTDPVTVEEIADALRTGTADSWTCDGRTWRTGTCGRGIELSAAGSICSCPNPEYVVRPCIETTVNWGGVNTATCSGPDQTMTVTFY